MTAIQAAPSLSLSVSDWAVLAILGEGQAHGFKVAAVLAKGGELGGVWTLQRPQVYRALEHLTVRELIETAGREAGENGPPRTLYRLTTAGRDALREWLVSPIRHLREVRSALLLKIIFLERAGLDTKPLLEAQRHVFGAILADYRNKLRDATGADRTAFLWRVEAAKAGLNFLESKRADL